MDSGLAPGLGWPRSTRRTALKIEQLGTLATAVVAFAALAALVLTGQAGLREDLRALQTDMRTGQAELRAGQERLRQDLAALGVRFTVVEHRADALEVRFAEPERRPGGRPAVSDSPGPGP